jgi:very-short-patch-repair endonuclease
MRRQHRAGTLLAWQHDRLQLLGFEWRPSEAEVKWINMYHQLRQFKVLHGHINVSEATTVSTSNSKTGRRNRTQAELARWLDSQARLLVDSKLSSQQLSMLRSLGVTLRLPWSEVSSSVELQGLNAHERKQVRKTMRLRALGRTLKFKPRAPKLQAAAALPWGRHW